MLLDLFLEVLLHASDAPKAASQHDVSADGLEAIGREVIDNREEEGGNVGLLAIGVAIEDIVADFVRDEL